MVYAIICKPPEFPFSSSRACVGKPLEIRASRVDGSLHYDWLVRILNRLESLTRRVSPPGDTSTPGSCLVGC